MTDHPHCWHPVTNTPAGETPYAQCCCWCGTMQYRDDPVPPAAHGPHHRAGQRALTALATGPAVWPPLRGRLK